jgi:hypothetical protein
MRLKQAVANLGLLFTSLCAALLLAEGLVRWVGPPQTPSGPGLVPTVYDSLLGWSKVPDTAAVVSSFEYSVVERINSQGLRGPEYEMTKPPDEYRVLVLGDSYAEGYTVEFTALSSQVLKRILKTRGDGAYEVINGGTAGYSTDQELLFFKHRGAAYKPDLTILFFYINDVPYNVLTRYWRGFKPRFVVSDSGPTLTNVPVPRPNPQSYPFTVEGGRGLIALVRKADSWLGPRSRLYFLIRNQLRFNPRLRRLVTRLGLASVPTGFTPWKKTADGSLEEAWDVTEALLVALGEETAFAGSEVMLFWVPTPQAVYPELWDRTSWMYSMNESSWSPTQEYTVLSQICERNGLDCLFSLDEFKSRAEQLERTGRRLYLPADGHWTADGHALVGEILARYISHVYLTGEPSPSRANQAPDPHRPD